MVSGASCIRGERDADAAAETDGERPDRMAAEDQARREANNGDAMQDLEEKAADAGREMAVADALDMTRLRNAVRGRTSMVDEGKGNITGEVAQREQNGSDAEEAERRSPSVDLVPRPSPKRFPRSPSLSQHPLLLKRQGAL